MQWYKKDASYKLDRIFYDVLFLFLFLFFWFFNQATLSSTIMLSFELFDDAQKWAEKGERESLADTNLEWHEALENTTRIVRDSYRDFYIEVAQLSSPPLASGGFV